MKQNIALLIIVIISLFIAIQPAFAQEQNIKDVSQKIEKLLEGLVGRIGVAANTSGTDYAPIFMRTAAKLLAGE
jgi:beta-lactamase class A